MSENKLIEGSVIRSLLRLSIPIVMANMLQTTYQLTDTFWVGRLGTNEVAALSLSFPIIFFLVSLGGGFTLSGTILVAQYSGQGRKDMVTKICFQTLVVIIVTSFLLSLIGYSLIGYVVRAMTHTPEVAEIAVSYLRISFIGLVFSYLYMMFQSLYRGAGDVKTPFYIVFITVLLNFFLDPLFIMGYGPVPAMGVDGAAYATVVTQGIAAVVALYFLAKGKGGIKLDIRKPEIDFKEIKKILWLGLPASAEQSSRSSAMLVLTFLVASFGDITLAAYGIGVRVLSFIIIPCIGFSMATSTLVGQNIGAGKKERAKECASVAVKVIFLGMTVAGAIFFVFAKEVLEIFVPGQEKVIAEGIHFIRLIGFTFGLVGVQEVSCGALRGGGSTMISLVISLVSLWMLRFPTAYILSKHTTLAQDGIYWSFPIGSLIGAIIATIVLKRGRWLNNLTGDPIEKAETKVIEAAITEEGNAN